MESAMLSVETLALIARSSPQETDRKEKAERFRVQLFETVKKPADMKDDRAAGELEGARPASS